MLKVQYIDVICSAPLLYCGWPVVAPRYFAFIEDNTCLSFILTVYCGLHDDANGLSPLSHCAISALAEKHHCMTVSCLFGYKIPSPCLLYSRRWSIVLNHTLFTYCRRSRKSKRGSKLCCGFWHRKYDIQFYLLITLAIAAILISISNILAIIKRLKTK